MASIIKRRYKGKKGDTIKYYIAYRDLYGKQHTIGGYSSLQDAKKHINDFDDLTCTRTDITVKDIFDLYFSKLNKKADSTYKNCKMYYNKYFTSIEHLQYKKTSIIFWQEFFDGIEQHSPYVAQLCLKFSKAAANNAINKNVIPINKFIKVDKINIPKPDMNHLTIDELKYVLEKGKSILKFKDYVCLYMFIGTGMREGEIFGLNTSDVNLKEFSVKVNKQFTGDKLKFSPKTSSSNRTVYYFQDLAEVLQEYISTVKGSILFPNNSGGYMNANNFRNRVWKKIKAACGITKRVRLHDLRGSYIDMTLSSGLSVKFTQNNVGHARSETTTNIYARNNDDMIRIAKEKINEIFTSCCRNVVEKPENKKSNILPFRKKSDISCF